MDLLVRDEPGAVLTVHEGLLVDVWLSRETSSVVDEPAARLVVTEGEGIDR